MLIYVAGPYRGDVEANIARAREVAVRLWDAGHTVICPHTNSGNFEQDCSLTDAQWLNGTLNLLKRCDALCLVPGWEDSKGTLGEIDYAKSQGIPIYAPGDIPPLHPTEEKCPKQCDRFLEVCMGIYRLHLSKNHDYSPANILATGEIGVTVRLWDKIARLMNLMGFRIDVRQGTYQEPVDPKHESVEDTLKDAASYSIIALLVREGLWGK